MAQLSQFTLPSLGEYVSKHKENFALGVRTGHIQGTTWEEQEKFVIREHKMLSHMDATQMRVYLAERNKREQPMLMALKEKLDRLLAAVEARANLVDSVRDVREQEAYAKLKRKAPK